MAGTDIRSLRNLNSGSCHLFGTVVLENIERWLEKGPPVRAAAITAMNEITGPILAITLVLSSAILPSAFLGRTLRVARRLAPCGPWPEKLLSFRVVDPSCKENREKAGAKESGAVTITQNSPTAWGQAMSLRVRYFILCDDVQISPNNLLRIDALGLITRIRSTATPPFPLVRPSFSVLLILTGGHGTGSFSIRIVRRSNGQVVFQNQPRQVNFSGSRRDAVGIVFRIRNCSFPDRGYTG